MYTFLDASDCVYVCMRVYAYVYAYVYCTYTVEYVHNIEHCYISLLQL